MIVACGAHAETRPIPSIRDSAGVRIVEYTTLEHAPAITLARRPSLDIGGVRADPSTELDPRAPYLDPVRLSDGRIVVSDMYRLVFFDSLGRMLGTAGRRGDGPAEFQQIAKVCPLSGDTLLSISENDRRVLLWDRDGNHLRTFPRVAPILMDSCFPDGSLIAPVVEGADDHSLTGRAVEHFSLDSVEYQRIAPNGSDRQSLGVHARTWFGSDVTYYVQVWYAHGLLYVADARKYEVRTYDSTGHSLRSILRVTVHLPTPRSRERRLLDSRRAPITTSAPGVKSQLGETESAFGRILLDERGWLWIRNYREGARWTVFDDARRLVGTLGLLKRSVSDWPTIVALDGERVVERRLDEDGAVHLRWFGVELPR